MQKTSSLAILLLAAATLNACVSSIKPETKQLDFYDFGLQSAENRVEFALPIESLNAADAIQHSNIRYRLNYKNPSQVFGYAESRWSTLPLDLVRQKLANTAPAHASCSLKLQILAFDQVFDSASSSQGIVQLQASLVDRRSRKLVQSTLVSAQSPASSGDAKGGVAALNTASTEALKQAAQWAGETSAAASECQAAAN
ncbi:ABC-type transport auxiliary lipoprotein family protein [Methylobacillus arboreus]|uniref:ABC-type transport auxiliary lipoprotein family protein n=1 Tax=Methylobacillus arboreus TaxID=755170 RepID=UPI001E315388|nr:ABC-type transport auxiliary lipoprotein family protein [Methylobacillus arboreus]MCB5190578.1 ABC-type transport auxiliary lipoprotein family protein [Methylobacillus arboreus]